MKQEEKKEKKKNYLKRKREEVYLACLQTLSSILVKIKSDKKAPNKEDVGKLNNICCQVWIFATMEIHNKFYNAQISIIENNEKSEQLVDVLTESIRKELGIKD